MKAQYNLYADEKWVSIDDPDWPDAQKLEFTPHKIHAETYDGKTVIRGMYVSEDLPLGSPLLPDGSTAYLVVARYDSWEEDAKDYGFWEVLGICATEQEALIALGRVARLANNGEWASWKSNPYDREYKGAEVYPVLVENKL